MDTNCGGTICISHPSVTINVDSIQECDAHKKYLKRKIGILESMEHTLAKEKPWSARLDCSCLRGETTCSEKPRDHQKCRCYSEIPFWEKGNSKVKVKHGDHNHLYHGSSRTCVDRPIEFS